jgi:NAD(P)-dependent dehydrogenase (short-subunit alcohol dehydrogenase family)
MGNASLMSFTLALGAVSPEHGVRVLGVNPGPVLTDRVVKISRKRAQAMLGDEERYQELLKKNPFGRPATVDEIAATVVFLASDLSSYTSGTIVTIDGGFSKRAAV